MPKICRTSDLSAYPAYQRLKRQLAGLPGLTFSWPPAGQTRVRKIIHRGAQRPTFKYHSFTQKRVLHCESILEQEALWRLDACPSVTFISEQPVRICLNGQNGFTHIPDFLAFVYGTWQVIEIKRLATVTNDVRDRTERLTTLLAPIARYKLITEVDLSNEVIADNCRTMLRRGRTTPTTDWQERTVAGIRRATQLPLSTYGWDDSGSVAAEGIAWLLLKGKLVADLKARLCGQTLVRVPVHNELIGDALWPA